MTASQSNYPAEWRLVVMITALVAIGPLATDLYLPSLPDMTQALDTEVARIQLTLSIYMWGFALAQLFHGPLSDRFGRRPVLLGGLSLYLLGTLFCVLAQSVETLIWARLIQAVGGCVGPVLGRTIVRDCFNRERSARVMAMVGAAMALAPAVAPIIGGWLHVSFGWRANFILLGAFGLLLVWMVLLRLPETNTRLDPSATQLGGILRNFAQLLSDGHYLLFTAIMATGFSGLFAFISGSAFVLIDYLGVPPQWFGLAFTCAVMGYVVGNLVSARWVGRWGISRLLLMGGGICLLSALGLYLQVLSGAITVVQLMLPVTLYLCGVGLILPNAMAGALADYPHMAGSASSLLGVLQMGLAAFAGYLVGLWYDGTALPISEVMLLSGSGAFCCALALVASPRIRHP